VSSVAATCGDADSKNSNGFEIVLDETSRLVKLRLQQAPVQSRLRPRSSLFARLSACPRLKKAAESPALARRGSVGDFYCLNENKLNPLLHSIVGPQAKVETHYFSQTRM
jgi:hypothetical protein